MSTADGVVAEVVAEEAVKAPRRFPPPCWTQDETLILIDAYRERWYSVRRGYLRTADWDAVAASVASRCPDASPSKTSAQCRHKMEKLRQRYRSEKQRSVSFPYPNGRYISSWFFFDNMEAMENGTSPPTARKIENSGDGSHLNSSLEQNPLKLKLKANNSGDSCPDLGFYSSVTANRSNSNMKISSDYSRYLEKEVVNKEEDMSSDEDLQNFERKTLIQGIPIHPLKSIESKNSGKNFPNYFEFNDGFHQETLPPGLGVKRSGKRSTGSNSNDEFWVKVSNEANNYNSSFNYPGFRAKLNPNADPRMTTSSSKRGRDAVEEMVASINSLGEGFMKMERAKMEMAREMEARRMDMEMKRNEMILGSQKQIVDAFMKGLLEMKMNKKAKPDKNAADLAET